MPRADSREHMLISNIQVLRRVEDFTVVHSGVARVHEGLDWRYRRPIGSSIGSCHSLVDPGAPLCHAINTPNKARSRMQDKVR
jgi:hypothetical protein